jgi:curved DNA-binding protein CbpA
MQEEKGRNSGSRQITNYYLILDIKRNADQNAIETAYARMALKFHPDVAGDSPDVQERFAKINEAYSILSKTQKKQDYDQQLGTHGADFQEEVITSDEGRGAGVSSEPAPDETAVPSRGTEKKEDTRPGQMSLKRLERAKIESRRLISQGDFWRADALLKQAVSFFPRDTDLRRLMARAAAGRGMYREAVEELRTATEVEYFNPENHYLMGRMYMQGNQMDNAVKAFNNALSWQEDYEPAIKALGEIKALEKKGSSWWKKVLRMGK